MSKWSRLKVVLLTTGAALVSLGYLGCLNFPSWKLIQQYVAIGSIFD